MTNVLHCISHKPRLPIFVTYLCCIFDKWRRADHPTVPFEARPLQQQTGALTALGQTVGSSPRRPLDRGGPYPAAALGLPPPAPGGLAPRRRAGPGLLWPRGRPRRRLHGYARRRIRQRRGQPARPRALGSCRAIRATGGRPAPLFRWRLVAVRR